MSIPAAQPLTHVRSNDMLILVQSFGKGVQIRRLIERTFPVVSDNNVGGVSPSVERKGTPVRVSALVIFPYSLHIRSSCSRTPAHLESLKQVIERRSKSFTARSSRVLLEYALRATICTSSEFLPCLPPFLAGEVCTDLGRKNQPGIYKDYTTLSNCKHSPTGLHSNLVTPPDWKLSASGVLPARTSLLEECSPASFRSDGRHRAERQIYATIDCD